MQTLNPVSMRAVNPQMDLLQEMLKERIERYNVIRDAILTSLKHLSPIEKYHIANKISFISMCEYQSWLVDYLNFLIEGKEISKVINFDKWRNVYAGYGEKIEKSWEEIIKIFEAEKIVVMELKRVSSEIETSAMESFVISLEHFVAGKKSEVKKEDGVPVS